MSKKSDKEALNKQILKAKETMKKMIDDMSNEDFLDFNMMLLDLAENDDYWEDDDEDFDDDDYDDDFDDDFDDDDFDDDDDDDDNNNIFDFPGPNDDVPF